jgi:hypothetical protein
MHGVQEELLRHRANAYVAGCIMCTLATSCLIMWLGVAPNLFQGSPTKVPPANPSKHGVRMSPALLALSF